ncbi:hypothetical protein ACWD0G_28890 [Streptomyces goshikiensis]
MNLEGLLDESLHAAGRLCEPDLGVQGDGDELPAVNDSQVDMLNLGNGIDGIDFVQLEYEVLRYRWTI